MNCWVCPGFWSLSLMAELALMMLLCDREQVAFLGECTVSIEYIPTIPANMRCLSWLISTKVAGELNSGMMSPAGFT